MATKLTRSELYALVWDRPMTKLAAEFSLSDVALHKICRKHDVPTPPVGYWAKKAHGKAVRITPLPRPGEGGSITIHEGAASDESEAMAMARAAVRDALAGWEPDPNVAPGANVIVERTVAKLEAARPRRTGLVTIEGNGLISVAVRPESVERAVLLLRLLGDAADRAGISLDAKSRPAVWQFQGEEVSFTFEEAADRLEHVPTDTELKAVARWEAKRLADQQRYGYLRDYGRPQIPKWEERFQGRLAVRLEEVRIRSESPWGPVIRRAFADSKTQDLVRAIPRVLSTVAAIAVAKRENREAGERRRLAREETERLRAKAERRAALERARVSALDTFMGEHERLVGLETYLASLERSVPADQAPPRVARLIGWLRARLERMRGQAAPAALEKRLAGTSLFDEDGD